MYAVIDIETTGGSPKSERITEIAIFIHDGEKVIDEFVTLVNPGRNIPYFITALTGITNEMVADAPQFCEVARKIVEITDGMVFVAHNARFDYSFVKQEFKALGYSYTRDTLDTVKLARQLIPGHRSYSLGNICSDLGIEINGRHRAAGDALATVKLLEILLERSKESDHTEKLLKGGRPARLNPCLDSAILENLPEEPGVYYFYNEEARLIYIGKSRNIRQRVLSHLSNSTTRRAMEMRDTIADISWEVTGSELIALLRESEEIKKFKPVYNRAQRRTSSVWGISRHFNEKGYLCFTISDAADNHQLLALFSSREKARQKLRLMIERHSLCQKLCGLYDTHGACFHHQVGLCHGACTGEEPPAAYNLRARVAMDDFLFAQENFFLIDRGRHDGEKSAVRIMNGKYSGFGFFDIEEMGFGLSAIHECIQPSPDNRDIQVILKSYMRNNRVEKIIQF
ncbi:MAG: exonuclease domain-containing protein [Bacteroidales bacterium]